MCATVALSVLRLSYGLDCLGFESRWSRDFSTPVHTGPGVHPASCTVGSGARPGVKSGRVVRLTPHPLPVSWSRKSRVIPLLPLWGVRPVQSLSSCKERPGRDANPSPLLVPSSRKSRAIPLLSQWTVRPVQSLSACKERPERDADPSPLLVPWSRKSRTIPLIPLCAVRPIQNLSACSTMHFTFTF